MKEYTISSKIGRTKLTKNDLSELLALINSGIPVRGITGDIYEDVKITAYLSNITIIEYGLENFLNHTDLPKILNFIVFNRSGWSESRSLDKTVHLLLGSGSSVLTVNGQDQAWVLGKHAQITDYLKSKRPILWFFSKNINSIIFVIVNSAFIALLVLIAIDLKYEIFKINPLWFFVLSSLSFLSIILNKMKNTMIVLKETESFWDKYGTKILIVLAFLTLIATLVIGVIQINQKY